LPSLLLTHAALCNILMLGSTLARETLLREPGRIAHKVATPTWAPWGPQPVADDFANDDAQDETLEVSIEDMFPDKLMCSTTNEIPSIAVTLDDEEGLDPEAAAELAAAALDAGDAIETELCHLGKVESNDRRGTAKTIADCDSVMQQGTDYGDETRQNPSGLCEDIELRIMEESDSDDQLPELYPLLERYFSEHVDALAPKQNKRSVVLGHPSSYHREDKLFVAVCWVCGLEHDSGTCPHKRCFFCAKLGHESRACPDRQLVCQHCKLRGHTSLQCPTLASQEPKFFGASRCMRCGAMGHVICGLPPLMPSAPQGPPFVSQTAAQGRGPWAPPSVLGAAAKSSASAPPAAKQIAVPTLQAETFDPLQSVEGLTCKSAPSKPPAAWPEQKQQQEQHEQQRQQQQRELRRPPKSLREVTNSLSSRRKPPEPQGQARAKRPLDASGDELPPQLERMQVPIPGKAPMVKRAPAAKAPQDMKILVQSMPGPKKIIRISGDRASAAKRVAGVPAPKKKQRQQKNLGPMPSATGDPPPEVIVCD